MKYSLRYHLKGCFNCRYFRTHKTEAFVSCCLFLGRDLGISNMDTDLIHWARERICDGWKRRPSTWNIYSEGVHKSPYWHDPYIPRKTQLKLDGREKEKAKNEKATVQS